MKQIFKAQKAVNAATSSSRARLWLIGVFIIYLTSSVAAQSLSAFIRKFETNSIQELNAGIAVADWLGQISTLKSDLIKALWHVSGDYQKGNSGVLESSIKDIGLYSADLASTLKKYEANISARKNIPEAETKVSTELLKQSALLQASVDKFTGAATSASIDSQALKLLASEADDQALILNDHLSEAQGIIRTTGADSYARAHSLSRVGELSDLGLAFILLPLLAYLGIVATRKVTAPIRTAVQSIDGSMNSLDGIAHNLADSSDALSNSSTQAAVSIEQTLALVSEFSEIVSKTSNHAENVAALSAESAELAQQGKLEIEHLGMAVKGITLSSRKIKEISTVIDGIAFQTNLLALNAAVEAARAGEQGKGFAVVADAVRTLAQKCAESSKAISAIVVESFAKSSEGEKLALKSIATMDTILASANKIASFNGEMASLSKSQTDMTQEIVNAMNHIDVLTQNNAKSSSKSAEYSRDLQAQSQEITAVLVDLRTLSGLKVAEKVA